MMERATGGTPRVSVDSLLGRGLRTSRSLSLSSKWAEARREGLVGSWADARFDSLRVKIDLDGFSFEFFAGGSTAVCIGLRSVIVLASEGVDERDVVVVVEVVAGRSESGWDCDVQKGN